QKRSHHIFSVGERGRETGRRHSHTPRTAAIIEERTHSKGTHNSKARCRQQAHGRRLGLQNTRRPAPSHDCSLLALFILGSAAGGGLYTCLLCIFLIVVWYIRSGIDLPAVGWGRFLEGSKRVQQQQQQQHRHGGPQPR
ncbi:unnamed protein product, partial [Laminaria digitata]